MLITKGQYKVYRNLTSILGLLCLVLAGYGQDTIKIFNSSFEDIPRQGNNPALNIRGWSDCGFPGESPPDIHPGNFWEVSNGPSHGNTYLGMVVRDNDTWEGLSQRLKQPIKSGTCYTFNIDLSQSKKYISGSRATGKQTNYTTPAVLRIWGGAGYCNSKELLAESTPITHSNWETYEFKFKARQSHNYILVEVYYKVPVLYPYCGHLLIDNLSNIVEVPCEKEQEEELTVVVPTKPKSQKLPPHKQGRVDEAKRNSVPKYETPVRPPKKKLLTDLDINKIKKGATIEIKNLYFDADTSSIDESSYEVLDEVYDFLAENQNIIVEIGGHTNGIPPHSYCDKLSTERAKSIYDYLIEKGIKAEKIKYKGYGKRKRIATDKTAEGRMKNQRVEIKILSIG